MARIRIVLLFVLLLNSLEGFSEQFAYRVNFRARTSDFTLADSASFLSARALARRANFSVVVDSSDLPLGRAFVDTVLARTNGKLHLVSKWFNFCVVLVSDSIAMHHLDGLSIVSSYSLVGHYDTYLHNNPQSVNAGSFVAARTTAHTGAYFGQTWVQTLIVKGNYLTDLGLNGNGKLIAVLDGGFSGTNTHPCFDSLRNAGRIVDHYNFVLDSTFVYSYDIHGTSVLSTISANVPGAFVGTATGASIALYVSEDVNSEQPIELLNMVAAMERADSLGADVITSSLGYNTFDNSAFNFNFSSDFDGATTIAAKGANKAWSKGIFFCASAGNEGGGPWNRILTPGDADSVMTIGSVDYAGHCPSTSGYGPNAAGQVKPDVCLLGEGAAVAWGTGYFNSNGTSFSTPQAAGWVACLMQGNPTTRPSVIKNAIIRCASEYLTPGNQLGYGIPDFQCIADSLPTTHIVELSKTPFAIELPNPVSSTVNIVVDVSSAQFVDFRITDISGRLFTAFKSFVEAHSGSPILVDVSSFSKGIYLLHAISTDGHQEVIKVLKD